MPKYTYKDVIIDPTSEEAKNCIGKVVYYSDSPTECLSYANKNNIVYCGTLKEIDTSTRCPFVSGINADTWGCIILKKEEPKPEYVPFENSEEFLDAYYHNETKNLNGIYHYLSTSGIWLKYKATDTRLVVTEMWAKGLTIGSETAVTRWNALLKYCEFLDGTPCGKIKE